MLFPARMVSPLRLGRGTPGRPGIARFTLLRVIPG